jgi:hypothetical protein
MSNAAEHQNLIAAPLWQRARAALARAFAALGGSAAIALINALTPALRRRIVAWLCPLENVVRKLLLAEAGEITRNEREQRERGPRAISIALRGIALHGTPRKGSAALLRRTASKAEGAAGAARSSLDLSNPETWPARFSLAPPRDPRAVPEASAPRIRSLWGPLPLPPPPPPPRRAASAESAAFRLARRFEALRRVLEDPLPHARRLARLLQRLERRFPEVIARYALAPARVGDFDAADPRLSTDAYGAGFNGARALADTS